MTRRAVLRPACEGWSSVCRDSSVAAAAAVAAAVALSGCASSPRQTVDPLPAAAPAVQIVTDSGMLASDTIFTMPPQSDFVRLTSGLMYHDVRIGTGTPAVDLREVEVHYTGRLADGSIFDSSRRNGRTFKFILGQRRVIPGWDQGIRGMRAGGRRILIVPPDLAYGPNGVPPDIPPNATLTFDVVLISVR